MDSEDESVCSLSPLSDPETSCSRSASEESLCSYLDDSWGSASTRGSDSESDSEQELCESFLSSTTASIPEVAYGIRAIVVYVPTNCTAMAATQSLSLEVLLSPYNNIILLYFHPPHFSFYN